jgi:hypothetical protein
MIVEGGMCFCFGRKCVVVEGRALRESKKKRAESGVKAE